jgi:hypothetical protein
MEAIKYLVKIPEKREVTVTVPPHIRANQIAELILMVGEQPDDYANKIQAMKAAASDELFLQDLKEVSADFQVVDAADWTPSP